MYSYVWQSNINGYRLVLKNSDFVASEIRPVFVDEIKALGLDRALKFDEKEHKPFLWAKQNTYIYKGETIAKVRSSVDGREMEVDWNTQLIEFANSSNDPENKIEVMPTDVGKMIDSNRKIMSLLVSDTLKRIKELYDSVNPKCDTCYIAFSGGKDSVVLLDLCNKVLPLDVPVVFSDTDMELPDTYRVWGEVQKQYPERTFIKAKAALSAMKSWELFGPPSQALRWCCSVHKSTPAIVALQERFKVDNNFTTAAFVGVRAEESIRRSTYDDVAYGVKNHSQINVMPILSWSAHELWLYIFANNLIINAAYKKGLPRVGCLMCPMSSERQNLLIRNNYTEAVKPFQNLIRNTINRKFNSKEDVDKFIYSGGWYARKSGVSLNQIMPEPEVKYYKDRFVCRFLSSVSKNMKEWLKAIKLDDGCTITFADDSNIVTVELIWKMGKINKTTTKWVIFAIQKAIACVGCRACVVECPTGALEIKTTPNNDEAIILIDGKRCIHCMKCFSPSSGCWRYYSTRYAGGTTMNIGGINKYMTFGLRPEWISILISEKEAFRQTSALGSRMIPSAVTWFREAGLILPDRIIKCRPVVAIGEKYGTSHILLWTIIWLELANNSPLVKWFLCNTSLNVQYSIEHLNELLAVRVSSASVRGGALQSLCQLLKNSPLSESDSGIVQLGIKGRSVVSIERKSKNIDSLIILYALYVVSEKAKRGTFTVRQMLVADFDSDFVSPIVAFGFQPDEFKKHCMGLSVKYPDFISCSFTLGLDEVKVFPESKCVDDVVALILQ